MPPFDSPYAISSTTMFAWWRMMAEAQIIYTTRMMGLAGIVPLARGDRERMFTEKGPAFATAAMAGMLAAMQGGTPDAVLRATLKPVERRTRTNLRRITRS